MVFENGVKNIQAAAYNGARTVFANKTCYIKTLMESQMNPYFEITIVNTIQRFEPNHQIPILKSDHQSLYFKAKIISKIKIP